jgi:hypothetical protein
VKPSSTKPKTSREPAFRFRPHSLKQSELIFSDSDLTIAGTGTQFGKSVAGALWMIRQMHQFTSKEDNFLILSPTYKILSQSVLPYFLDFARHMGTYRRADGVFERDGGGFVYFRTETDPDSIVGIPRTRAYWLDEAGKVSLYFHENILARAASVGARGLYTTSPYSRNWLYKDYIKPFERGMPVAGVKLIRAASWENPYHSLSKEENLRKMQASMDPRRFEMLFGGEWGKQSGLVYDCFDDVENVCEPFRLPRGTTFYAGIDWGHTEPFVIVVRAVTPMHEHYQVSEFYKTGMTIPDQIAIARQKMQTWGIRQFFCGHERPENILLFNQRGIPAIGVPEKDIQVGTDLHYELLKTRRYKIFKGSSPHSQDEYETYHYPEPQEVGTDDDVEDDLPVGQNDHCMSANRFVTLRTWSNHSRLAPFTPTEQGTERSETQEARIKRLMRPSHRTRIVQ